MKGVLYFTASPMLSACVIFFSLIFILRSYYEDPYDFAFFYPHDNLGKEKELFKLRTEWVVKLERLLCFSDDVTIDI